MIKRVITSTILCVSMSLAAPQIKVDNADFDFGMIPADGKEIQHTYKITNTGDEVLKIEKVKPGCSCTVVQFDPEIKPGETKTVTASLATKERSGQQDKPITVVSNAENAPILKLSMKAFILGPVNLDKRYAIYPIQGKKIITDSIIILTNKKDFKITHAWYVKRSPETEKPAEGVKIPVKVTLVATGKKVAAPTKELKLSFSFKTTAKDTEAGTIYFKTNHPDSPLIEFRCMLEKR